MTFAILEIPRPVYDEIRERLIDRQPETLRAEYARLLTEVDGVEVLLIGLGSPSAIAFRALDADERGAYPRPSWTEQGPGPMDGDREAIVERLRAAVDDTWGLARATRGCRALFATGVALDLETILHGAPVSPVPAQLTDDHSLTARKDPL